MAVPCENNCVVKITKLFRNKFNIYKIVVIVKMNITFEIFISLFLSAIIHLVFDFLVLLFQLVILLFYPIDNTIFRDLLSWWHILCRIEIYITIFLTVRDNFVK